MMKTQDRLSRLTGWFVALLLIIGASATMAHAKTYKIGVIPWAGCSGMHVADARKIWEADGLDVRLITFPTSQAMFAAVEKGLLDMAYQMAGSVVGFNMKGGEFVLIMETDWSDGGDKIVAKQGVKLADVKGKALGVYLNEPSVTFFLNKYLTTRGLKLSDFRILEMETDQLAKRFVSGLFSAIVAYDPDALKAEREGNGTVVATSASYEGCIPEGLFMLRQQWDAADKGALVRIIKGYLKGVDWLKQPQNWPAYQQILNENTFKGAPPFSEADLKAMVDAVAIHDREMLLERNRTGGGMDAYLKELKRFLADNGMLESDFSPGDVFVNQVVMDALQ